MPLPTVKNSSRIEKKNNPTCLKMNQNQGLYLIFNKILHKRDISSQICITLNAILKAALKASYYNNKH